MGVVVVFDMIDMLCCACLPQDIRIYFLRRDCPFKSSSRAGTRYPVQFCKQSTAQIDYGQCFDIRLVRDVLIQPCSLLENPPCLFFFFFCRTSSLFHEALCIFALPWVVHFGCVNDDGEIGLHTYISQLNLSTCCLTVVFAFRLSRWSKRVCLLVPGRTPPVGFFVLGPAWIKLSPALLPLLHHFSFLRNGVEDAAVINTADIFFPHLPILRPQHDIRRQPCKRKK